MQSPAAAGEAPDKAPYGMDDRCFGADGKLAPPASDGGIFDAADLVRSAAVISLADGPALQQRMRKLEEENARLQQRALRAISQKERVEQLTPSQRTEV